MSKEIIAALTAPWSHDEIKWRVGSLTKDKTKTKPLAYIDARTVMERLDAAVGVENWQDRYEFHGTRTLCYLSIRINGEWICKSDGAGDSDIESEKGGLSDAFKRASVKWGMGRELYEMKTRWMPVDEFKQMVGDPWDFVIKNNNAPKAPNPPKVDNKEVAEKLMTDITNIFDMNLGNGAAAFKAWWGAEESKLDRAKLKSLDAKMYDTLNAKYKAAAEVFIKQKATGLSPVISEEEAIDAVYADLKNHGDI